MAWRLAPDSPASCSGLRQVESGADHTRREDSERNSILDSTNELLMVKQRMDQEACILRRHPVLFSI